MSIEPDFDQILTVEWVYQIAHARANCPNFGPLQLEHTIYLREIICVNPLAY